MSRILFAAKCISAELHISRPIFVGAADCRSYGELSASGEGEKMHQIIMACVIPIVFNLFTSALPGLTACNQKSYELPLQNDKIKLQHYQK